MVKFYHQRPTKNVQTMPVRTRGKRSRRRCRRGVVTFFWLFLFHQSNTSSFTYIHTSNLLEYWAGTLKIRNLLCGLLTLRGPNPSFLRLNPSFLRPNPSFLRLNPSFQTSTLMTIYITLRTHYSIMRPNKS